MMKPEFKSPLARKLTEGLWTDDPHSAWFAMESFKSGEAFEQGWTRRQYMEITKYEARSLKSYQEIKLPYIASVLQPTYSSNIQNSVLGREM